MQANPDKPLRTPTHELGVWPNAIWYACRQMKITYKKPSLSRRMAMQVLFMLMNLDLKNIRIEILNLVGSYLSA